jgi:biotin carboxyl carrier protein
MKRLVNGVEAELTPSGARIRRVGDRLLVSTAEGTAPAVAVRHGDTTYISYLGRQFTVEPVKAARKHDGKDHSGDLISPMPGVVVEVLISEGSEVAKGDKIMVLEAMKTQQTFVAPFDGTLSKVSVFKGDQVTEGMILAVVEPRD